MLRKRARRKPVQVEMTFRTWGGKRANAGRRPGPGRRGLVAHAARPPLSASVPVHVTMRAVVATWLLREEIVFVRIRRQIANASRGETRILHFSVQTNHIHLIVEAPDRVTLARRIQGLASGIARIVNGFTGRRGLPFWRGRYHREDLRSPREVRNRIVYVIFNHRNHRPRDVAEPGQMLDPCSSAAWMEGWDPRAGPALARLRRDPLVSRVRDDETPVRAPKKWLARTGWKRHGLLLASDSPRP